MTLEKLRVGLGIALAFTLILLWQSWINEERERSTRDAPTPPTAASNLATPSPPATAAALPGPATLNTASAAATVSEGQRIRLASNLLDVDIDLLGGDIVGARLLAYPADLTTNAAPFTLLTDVDPERYHFQSGWLGTAPIATPETRYETRAPAISRLPDNEDQVSVTLTTTTPEGLSLTKTITLERDSYVVKVKWTLGNQGSTALSLRGYAQLLRQWHPSKTSTASYTGAAVSTPERHYERVKFDDMAAAPLAVDVASGWVAMLQHYFVSAVLPAEARDGKTWHLYSKAVADQRYIIGAMSPALELAAGASTELDYRYYIGPKLQDVLEAAAPSLDLTVDYGSIWIFAKPLWWLMSVMHDLSGNWGWAIVLLTVTVKAAFYRLSAASYRSMAHLRRVQPKITALRERYADDATQLNKAMMDIYREEKINPLGGCLPLLVQAPVFFSLYWVLLESVELRQAPWILWIHDLSAPDPYFVLPLVMGVTMLLQTRLNPPAADPMQQRMMEIMPIVFTAFTAFFASGLVLYWLVNNVLSIAQQWLITRSIEADPHKTAG
jgi:YidC/Oxa1 family membrane protein insertase